MNSDTYYYNVILCVALTECYDYHNPTATVANDEPQPLYFESVGGYEALPSEYPHMV